MFVALIMTLALGYGLARVMIGQNIKEIVENWGTYRCRPEIIITGNLYKPDKDPRSGLEYAYDNFNFCASELAKNVLSMALKPVLDIFYQMMNSAIQSVGFAMNLRTLASSLYNGLNRITDVFARRFNLVIHELHKNFLKQFSALQKANAIANASVFAGISVLRTILNLFKLMIIVVISILVVLVILTIFLFFILAPVIPVILMAIGVITATAFAGGVGGMSDTFCFAPNTAIRLAGGGTKTIKEIRIGDRLANDSIITAAMMFDLEKEHKMYSVDGVIVSGAHIIYVGGIATFVENYKSAIPIECADKVVYCLNTSNHKIPVMGLTTDLVFADWEELGSTDMSEWDVLVRYLLNNTASLATNKNSDLLDSEGGFTADCSVQLWNVGDVPIGKIKIGDYIADPKGYTKVIGIVGVDGDESSVYGSIGTVKCSGASWVRDDDVWKRAAETINWNSQPPAKQLFHLVTESGTFIVNGEVTVRDFTDIGVQKIRHTYGFTIDKLNKS